MNVTGFRLWWLHQSDFGGYVSTIIRSIDSNLTSGTINGGRSGRLVDRIESMGLMDKTMIIFTSDHGFYLGEHNIFGKALIDPEKRAFGSAPLYQEVAGVPLLIYLPGAKPRHTPALVSPPDFMATILQAAGAKVPRTVQGSSFLPVIKGEKDTHHQFVVSTMQLQEPGETTLAVDDTKRKVAGYLPATITTDKWSLLYWWQGASLELYDVEADPDQQDNVIRDNDSLAKEIHQMYYQFLTKIGTEDRLLKPRAGL